MNKQDLKKIYNEISNIKDENKEELWLMFQYFINCYINSIFNIGLTSNITKESLITFKEFYHIIKTENNILSQVIIKYKKLEYDHIIKLLNDLDSLNEKTFNYYYSLFDNIEDAIFTKDEYRIKRIKKNFNTLIETTEFNERII